jgi:hypothetical protein
VNQETEFQTHNINMPAKPQIPMNRYTDQIPEGTFHHWWPTPEQIARMLAGVEGNGDDKASIAVGGDNSGQNEPSAGNQDVGESQSLAQDTEHSTSATP